MIDLEKTILVMDGPSDIQSLKLKLQKEFGANAEFRKAPSNGHTVSADGYTHGVYPIILFALNSSYSHIICILDREKRSLSAQNLSSEIKRKLIDLLCNNTKFKYDELILKIEVVVADRMLENWIVADVEGIKSKNDLVKQDIKQDLFEGQSGVNILKNFMKINYNKVLHAPILFKSISHDTAKENSPSFKYFLNVIGAS